MKRVVCAQCATELISPPKCRYTPAFVSERMRIAFLTYYCKVLCSQVLQLKDQKGRLIDMYIFHARCYYLETWSIYSPGRPCIKNYLIDAHSSLLLFGCMERLPLNSSILESLWVIIFSNRMCVMSDRTSLSWTCVPATSLDRHRRRPPK
jgi:hypothetical protein